MATYAELQTRVQQIVIDLPTAVTSQVPKLVNEAIRKLQRDHNFKLMEATTAVLSTTVSTRLLAAVPSDFKELRGLPYLIEAQGQTRDLLNPANRSAAVHEIGTDEGGEADAELVSGPPLAVLMSEPTDETGAANFEVWPLPDGLSLYANGEYRIRIPYWKYLTVLSASGSSNWFTTHAEEWIVWQAASDAFFLDWDEERGALWAQKAATAKSDVIVQDKRFRLAGVTHLVGHSGAAGSRLRR